MNLEQLEYRLTLLSGRRVMVVKPDFGRLSISYVGNLSYNVSASGCVLFNFTTMSNDIAMVFSAEDVVRIDNEFPDEKESVPIIRLKGPQQYNTQYTLTA